MGDYVRSARFEASTRGVVDRRTGGPVPHDVKAEIRQARRAAEDARRADHRLRVSVQKLRGLGVSWTVIGDAIGSSRSAASRRFGADRLF